MMQVVRKLTRLQIDFGELAREYQPFRTPGRWIPCGDRLSSEHTGGIVGQDSVDHPAYVAKVFLFRAITVMDTYCGAGCLQVLTEEQPTNAWHHLFDGVEEKEQWMDCKPAIMIGLRDRKGMVERLMQSLYGEISGFWAVSDRSTRMDKDGLIYDEAAEDAGMDEEEEKDPRKVYQAKMLAPFGSKCQATHSLSVERRIFVQLLVNYYLFRNQTEQLLHLVCNYILSSAPSLELEEYPKLQPTLSLVVLEAMLGVDKDLEDAGLVSTSGNNEESLNGRKSNDSPSLSFLTQILGTQPSKNLRSSLTQCIEESVALAIHTTAAIWRQRLLSSEDRITNNARTEWASYLRMLESHGSLLRNNAVHANEDDEEKAGEELEILLKGYKDSFIGVTRAAVELLTKEESNYPEKDERAETISAFSASSALTLMFVLKGESCRPKEEFESALEKGKPSALLSVVFLASFMAFRQSEIILVDRYRNSIGTARVTSETGPWIGCGKDYTTCLLVLLGWLKGAIKENQPEHAVLHLGKALLDCCALVSNGEIAYCALELIQSGAVKVAKVKNTQQNSLHRPASQLTFMDSLRNMAQVPTVRVINLQRRPDRMNLMLSQAMQSGIFLLKGVASWGENGGRDRLGIGDITEENDSEDTLFGGYAFDGKVALDEISAKVFDDEPSSIQRQRRLEKIVAKQWRPHDVKAFDRFATDDENLLVRISDSERACALSHIATWKGVLRSLDMIDPKMTSGSDVHRNVQRLALCSGYARGEAFDSQNANMPPSPVCVVLEDDAILVDRFADRLDEILEELPRDFHFCSLGYGRPKTAPLVKYSTHLGIPTNIFYLTGYMLSLDGAKHLLDSLPVCGPIDSWIGFKMVANFDNKFGALVGLGNKSSVAVDMPPKREISQILRFRAFAALVPLCNQKVGGGSGASRAGVPFHNWRLRDTDIEYSGSANYSG